MIAQKTCGQNTFFSCVASSSGCVNLRMRLYDETDSQREDVRLL